MCVLICACVCGHFKVCNGADGMPGAQEEKKRRRRRKKKRPENLDEISSVTLNPERAHWRKMHHPSVSLTPDRYLAQVKRGRHRFPLLTRIALAVKKQSLLSDCLSATMTNKISIQHQTILILRPATPAHAGVRRSLVALYDLILSWMRQK